MPIILPFVRPSLAHRMTLPKFSRLCLLHRSETRMFMLRIRNYLSVRPSFVFTPSLVKSPRLNPCIAHQPMNHQYNWQKPVAFSTRRRRRRQGGGVPSRSPEDDSGSVSADDLSSAMRSARGTSLSPEQFLSVSKSLLDRVESAANALKSCNDGLEVTRHPPSSLTSDASTDQYATNLDESDDSESTNRHHGGQLSFRVQSSGDLFWGGGTYLLTIHPDDGGGGGYITLRSPLSGTFSYVYDSSAGEWVGGEDGHSLLGMLTRDWIRQCQGVPDF